MFNLDTDSLKAKYDPSLPDAWFDRFYFNVHSSVNEPYLLVGGGVFPARGIIDGYVIYVEGNQQLNARFTSSYPRETSPSSVGPLSWEVLEPMNKWRVVLDKNETGLEFDFEWTARTGLWNCDTIAFDTGRNTVMNFDHGFQSGTHQGQLIYRSNKYDLSGHYGQRDRSRGRRATGGGQGAHLWIQGQFEHEAVSFMLDLTRSNEILILDGAILHTDGSFDEITEIKHFLSFEETLDMDYARFDIKTRSGRSLELLVDPTVAAGGYLSGGGYGGQHGSRGGETQVSHEIWDLDNELFTPRHLDTPLTDRLSAFKLFENNQVSQGSGIAEFSHSRSSSYKYSPTLALQR